MTCIRLMVRLELGHQREPAADRRRSGRDCAPSHRGQGPISRSIQGAFDPDRVALGGQVLDAGRLLGERGALHGVRAEALASPSTGDDSTALYAIAQDQAADLIVAGAYGHSRVREWVLGGVTHDLLRGTQRCSLLSH